MTLDSAASVNVYRVLSRIFLSPPDVQLVEILQGEFLPALKEEYDEQQFPEKLRHSIEALGDLFHRHMNHYIEMAAYMEIVR